MDSFISFLSDILGQIFDTVLTPILKTFLDFVIKQLGQILLDAFGWILYFLWSSILKLLGSLSAAVDIFAGTSKNIKYNGTQTTLLQALFQVNAIKVLFLSFTLVGLGLCLIFSIINVIKSMSDMTLENKNPISKVLKNTMKSMVTFAVIPILCIFLLNMASILCRAVQIGLGDSANIPIDRLVWLQCSYNATTNDSLNLKSAPQSNYSKIRKGEDDYRKAYVSGTSDYSYASVKDSGFKDKFDYAKFDYFVGFTAGIVLVLVYAGCVFIYVGRLFEILILYITGPLFASTIANDGGEMFKNWKDMFVAKFVGGYSVIFGMKLFTVMIPSVISGDIIFTATNLGVGENGFFNTCISLLFIVGGAYGVYKSQTMVLRLISIEAAMAAEQSSATGGMLARFAGNTAIGGAKAVGTAAAGALLGSNKNQQGNGKSGKGSNAFTGGGSGGSGYRGGNPNGD